MAAEGKGCVRLASEVGKRLFKYLDTIPVLCCNLDKPGVLARCQRQWAEAPPEKHSRVSNDFFSPQGTLYPDTQAMDSEGGGMSDRLKREVLSLKRMSLNDKIGEGAHAVGSWQARMSQNCNWGWVASSMTLEENLNGWERSCRATGSNIETEWARHTSVLQVGEGSHQFRPKKIHPAAFATSLYGMDLLRDFDQKATYAPGGGDGGDGDEPGDTPPGSTTGGDYSVAADETSAAAGAPTTPVASGVEVAVLPEEEPDFGSEDCRLMRDYLTGCLGRHSYVSVITPPELWEDGQIEYSCFQVLDVLPREKVIETYRERVAEANRFAVSVQPLEVFRMTGTGDTTQLDTYVITEPCVIDLVQVIGSTSAEDRSKVHMWQYSVSDIDGCLLLQFPSHLQPIVSDWLSPSTPVLSILDHLHTLGYAPSDTIQCHGPDTQLRLYDSRDRPSKRTYYQCILIPSQLFANGVDFFDSSRTVAFYKALLRLQRPIPRGLKAIEYTGMIKAETAPAKQLSLPYQPLVLQIGRALGLPAPGVSRLAVAAGLSSDEEPVPVPAGVPAIMAGVGKGDGKGSASPLPETSTGPVVGAGDSSDENARPASAAEPPSDADPFWDGAPPFEHTAAGIFVHGRRVTVREKYTRGNRNQSERWSVTCLNPAHQNCSISRSINKDFAVFGAAGIRFFIGAWLKNNNIDDHDEWMPDRSDMEAYRDELIRRGHM